MLQLTGKEMYDTILERVRVKSEKSLMMVHTSISDQNVILLTRMFVILYTHLEQGCRLQNRLHLYCFLTHFQLL